MDGLFAYINPYAFYEIARKLYIAYYSVYVKGKR
jgi:hypothetical protein